MVKMSVIFALLSIVSPAFAFEKIPSQYWVEYGNSTASIQVVEYFSLSCPKCLDGFIKDFTEQKEKYIKSGKVRWIFHPHPADILTLQAMVCLEILSTDEKRVFWEVIVEHLKTSGYQQGAQIMQVAMETFRKPVPDLRNLTYLENSTSFKTAFTYLKQPDVIRELPTIEINRKIFDEFPSHKFIDKQLTPLLTTRNSQ